MKKIVQFLSVGATSLLLISGCGGAPTASGSSGSNDTASKGSSSQKAAELDWNKTSDPSLKGQEIAVLWSDTNGADGPKAKLLKQFTQETGIKVKELGVDYNSLYNKVTTAAMSNSSDIDVVEMDTIWAGQYLKGNITEDLTNVIPKDVQSTFTQSSLSSVTYDGHIVAVPWYSSTKHFYWNNALLKKAGIDHPPTTWDEFEADSKKLAATGVYASGWSWKQAESLTCDYVSLVYAFGGKFFDDNGKPAFNQGGGLKALQYMVDLIQKDKTVDPASLQWTEEDVKHAFEIGKIAMMSNWEGQYPELNDPTKSKVVNQTDMGLMPGEGDVVSSAVTGSEGVAVMKSSKHKEAALALAKWIGSKEYQLSEFQQEGQYPSIESLYTDPEMKKTDTTNTLDKIAKQFDYGHNRPNAPGYVSWSDTLAAELHAALLGQKSPQDALNEAAQKIQQAMADAKS